MKIRIWIGVLLFSCGTAFSAKVIEFKFTGFTGPVTTAAGGSVDNTGTYGAAGDGSVSGLNGGSVTATDGPKGAGDIAIEVNDANAPGETANKGGGVYFALPVITNDWSYAFSVRRDGDQEKYDRVFGVGSLATEASSVSFTDADGTLSIGVGGRNFYYSLPDATWIHFAVTYDANGGADPATQGLVKIYIDGVLQSFSQGAFVDNTKDNLSETEGEAKSLGFQVSNSYRPFNGAFDNVVVYDETLSDAQVEALYQGTVPGPATIRMNIWRSQQ